MLTMNSYIGVANQEGLPEKLSIGPRPFQPEKERMAESESLCLKTWLPFIPRYAADEIAHEAMRTRMKAAMRCRLFPSSKSSVCMLLSVYLNEPGKG